MNPLRIEGQKTVVARDRAAVRLGVARLGHPAERQPGQRRGALRGLPMMLELGLIARMPAPLRGAGGARQPDVPRLRRRARTSVEPIQRRGDARERDPNRQPGERAARDGGAQGDERRRRAGHRGGARRRLRPRRPDGPLHVPAHGRRPRVPLQAARARARRAGAARRRRLDRQRPEVHRVQARRTTSGASPGVDATRRQRTRSSWRPTSSAWPRPSPKWRDWNASQNRVRPSEAVGGARSRTPVTPVRRRPPTTGSRRDRSVMGCVP